MTDDRNNCPECGESLKGRDPKKHAVSHWGPHPIFDSNLGEEGIKRAKILGHPDVKVSGVRA